jgi:2-amino-4-hydroxy-6-hydroxymethyldihydropteridine diphosphokinase
MKNKKEKIMSNTVFLSLGSNLGDRERNIKRACEMLAAMEGFEWITASSIYVTPPVDMEEGVPNFLNIVVKGQFDFTPMELLRNLEEMENKLGRESKGDKQPRTIDIDILLFGDKRFKNEYLTIPHPRMTKRAFVLVPLLQIEPDIVYPLTGKKLENYLNQKEADSLILYRETVRDHV